MDLNHIDMDKFVQYINIELSKDKKISVNKLCDRIGIKKSTLKSRMIRAKYSYNAELRQYIKDDMTSNITISNKEILQEVKEEVSATNDNTSNITPLNDMSNVDLKKLNLLLNNLDDLLKLVSKKDITRNVTSLRSGDNRTTSLRIDSALFEKAKQRAKDNDMTVGEILNRALEDYLNNYL